MRDSNILSVRLCFCLSVRDVNEATHYETEAETETYNLRVWGEGYVIQVYGLHSRC